MTDLYYVQTTGDEPETETLVVVHPDPASPFLQSVRHGHAMRWRFADGGTRYEWPSGPHLDLDTLTRLHLLTYKELQARDAELLERSLKAIADLPTPDSEERMAGHEDAYRAIEAMKGQTHER